MPAKKDDQNPFGEGDLNQELIDQMLNGGDLGVAVQEEEVDPWSDETLQSEIDAARTAAGVSIEESRAPTATVARAAPALAPAPVMSTRATPTAVAPVQFMPLRQDLAPPEQVHGIELLMDVALEVSVELGRSHMSIADILALRTGSVIELDKLAGEPVEVSVNGTLIARGEVVVVDEKFGVRITEVVSKSRRLASVG
jgi:flagellar motor switch protein FliN/FliY